MKKWYKNQETIDEAELWLQENDPLYRSYIRKGKKIYYRTNNKLDYLTVRQLESRRRLEVPYGDLLGEVV